MSRLEQIEELEDSMSEKLAVIGVTAHNCRIAVKQGVRCNEEAKVLEDLQTIESNCKELMKLAATAIGNLQAYDKLLEGSD